MRFANLISFLAVESRYLVPGMIIIATSKIAVTLDNYSKRWYNMSQGDEKNGQNAAQCGAESSCWTTRTNNTYVNALTRRRTSPWQNCARNWDWKQLLNDEDKQHISRRRHRAAVSAAVQPRYESDRDAVIEGKGAFAQMEVPDCWTLA